MRTVLLLCLLSAVVTATPVAHGAEPPSHPAYGTWKMAETVIDGRKAQVAPDTVMVLTSQDYTVTIAGNVVEKGAVKHGEAGKEPHEIDFLPSQGPNAGKVLAGIYKIEQDVSLGCHAAPGQPRPTEFSSKPGRMWTLSTWRRVADAGKYHDEKFGFSLAVPSPWKSAPLQKYTVPGVVRAAWEGAGRASIVAFVQEPGKAFSARYLLDASAKSVQDAFDAKIVAQEVRTISGMKAMWLVDSGKGTGGAMTSEGNVDTTQHWVAVPRERDVVVVLLTSPTADYAANQKSFEQAIASLEIEGVQTDEQQASN